jgi:inner membrane protein
VGGLAIGLAGHLLRDVGTGPGVALLWPASDSSLHVPFGIYLALLAALAAVAAWRARP